MEGLRAISRRRFLIVACIGAAGSLLAACQSAPQSAPASKPIAGEQPPASKAASSLDQLYEAAKREGQVITWGPEDPEPMKLMAEDFNKRFPGIQVKHFEITAGESVERIIAEAQVGKVSLDMGMASLGNAIPLMERDLLAAYDDWSSLFGISPQSVIAGGRLLFYYHLSHPLAINTQALGSLPVPESWEDILKPEYRGRIIVEPRAKAFDALGAVWGEEKLRQYLTRLKEQRPTFIKGGTTVLQSLMAGEAPLAIGTYGYKVRNAVIEQGAPLTWGKFSPMGTSSFTVYILKGAAHPNAARLLAGWLATPEGQRSQEKHTGKSSLAPGAGSALADEYEKAGIKLIYETPENAAELQKFENLAAQLLGTMK